MVLRLQSGTELVTTYGLVMFLVALAIVIVVVLVSAPAATIPKSCSIYGGLQCQDISYGVNTLGGSILLVRASFAVPGMLNVSSFNAVVGGVKSVNGFCSTNGVSTGNSSIGQGASILCLAYFPTNSLSVPYAGSFNISADYCTGPSHSSCPKTNGYVFAGTWAAQGGGPVTINSVAVAATNASTTTTVRPSQHLIPITITNNQVTPTGSNFQEIISFNSFNTLFVTYEANDLGNIRFFAGPTELNSWCENCNNGIGNPPTNAIFWVKLTNSIPGNSNIIVNMSFLSNTVEFNGTTAGECPTCSVTYNNSGYLYLSTNSHYAMLLGFSGSFGECQSPPSPPSFVAPPGYTQIGADAGGTFINCGANNNWQTAIEYNTVDAQQSSTPLSAIQYADPGILALNQSLIGDAIRGLGSDEPTIDGYAVNYNVSDPDTSGTVNATASANDVIVLFVSDEADYGAVSQVCPDGISDDAGLTWQERGTPLTGSTGGAYPSYTDAEVWYAKTPNALYGDQITVNFCSDGSSPQPDDAIIMEVGISNANTISPWDSNPTLPAAGVFNATYPSSIPSSSPIGYGKYDNGKNVFSAYFNGGEPTSSFTIGGSGSPLYSAVPESYGGTYADTVEFVGNSGSGGFVYTGQNLPNSPNYYVVEDNWMENPSSTTGTAELSDGTFSGSTPSNTTMVVNNWGPSLFGLMAQQNNNGNGGPYPYPVGSSGQNNQWFYTSLSYNGPTAPASKIGYFFGSIGTKLYSPTYSATYTQDYYGVPSFTNPIGTKSPLYLTTTTFGEPATIFINWERGRAYPPNGAMPTVSFGSFH